MWWSCSKIEALPVAHSFISCLFPTHTTGQHINSTNTVIIERRDDLSNGLLEKPPPTRQNSDKLSAEAETAPGRGVLPRQREPEAEHSRGAPLLPILIFSDATPPFSTCLQLTA